ncbi:hypothetical protein HK098_006098 [Nowakowskiella sp. JEL0407]|nr:hypothetical protein HK098_006098 [Nowakowskiella sp. JEL0407]
MIPAPDDDASFQDRYDRVFGKLSKIMRLIDRVARMIEDVKNDVYQFEVEDYERVKEFAELKLKRDELEMTLHEKDEETRRLRQAVQNDIRLWEIVWRVCKFELSATGSEVAVPRLYSGHEKRHEGSAGDIHLSGIESESPNSEIWIN